MAKRKQRRDEFQDISSYSSKQAYKKNQKNKKRTGHMVFWSYICLILELYLINNSEHTRPTYKTR